MISQEQEAIDTKDLEVYLPSIPRPIIQYYGASNDS